MSKIDKLREMIRELIRKELAEATTSGATPGYQTPYAFTGGSGKGKKKKKEISTNSTGYNVVKEGSYEEKQITKQIKNGDLKIQIVSDKGKSNMLNVSADTLKKIAKIMLQEGKYHNYRNDDTLTTKQKIGRSMREVRDSLVHLEGLVKMNVRLKNELNVDSRSYWKNTHKALNKISERLVKLANKVGQLQ